MTDILHMDSDDMVRKGYDWMLKAASQAHQEKVFNYLMQNKAVMPRTALRYASLFSSFFRLNQFRPSAREIKVLHVDNQQCIFLLCCRILKCSNQDD